MLYMFGPFSSIAPWLVFSLEKTFSERVSNLAKDTGPISQRSYIVTLACLMLKLTVFLECHIASNLHIIWQFITQIHLCIFFIFTIISEGFPGGASSKESTCQSRRHKRHGFDPQVQKIPWSREWHPTPGFLSGESHGQRSLAGYSPWGHKRQDTT